MNNLTFDEAREAIYKSLASGNENIDLHIRNLKAAMNKEGIKAASFNPDLLPQNNRAGKKMMQSYFKKRGIPVVFEK